MKIGIVGYQGCGKSALFQWLTGIAPDVGHAHTTQSAMAPAPDDRIARLCEIYQPKKVTHASLELVDTPGLSRKHEGNPARLAMIREAGCLLMVVPAFDGFDPAADLASFEEDLLLTDLEIITGRAERLRESIKKPRPDRAEQQAELAAIEPLIAALEAGKAIRDIERTPEQEKLTRSFQFLTEKPRMVLVNVADDEDNPDRFVDETGSTKTVAVAVRLEQELAEMESPERQAFLDEMGLAGHDRSEVLRTILDASGQRLFFTAGEKEVRSWMIHQEATAVEAADSIHSDLARGFIRAETMQCDDLFRLGSEREIKAAGLMRQEPKDYVLQNGDIINIKFSV